MTPAPQVLQSARHQHYTRPGARTSGGASSSSSKSRSGRSSPCIEISPFGPSMFLNWQDKHGAFRHLVVAIASTHELLLHVDSIRLDVFALTQCNKATELLRARSDWQPSYLVVSCILMVAYSLLRCDYAHADLGVENGLKIPLCEAICKNSCCASAEAGGGYKTILTRLGKSHGFKLWTPDISHQFEKSTASQSCMTIETDHVRGPFTSTGQILKAYKDIMIQVVARLMRNLARGAYIPQHSPVAQEAIRQLAMFAYYWEKMYSELPEGAEAERLELKHLRIGLDYAYVLFFSKIISPRERTFDAYSSIVDHALDLAEDVMAAYQDGRPVVYVDRVVNGPLFSMAMCSRCPKHKERAMRMLRAQSGSPDGLDHWLRGIIIDLLVQAENREWGERELHAYLPKDRITFSDMSCHEQTIRMDSAVVGPTTEYFDFIETEADWEPWFGPGITSSMVHDACQGIMAAYRTYGKPRPTEAPCGYVREMRYKGRPVQVLWDEDWRPEGVSEESSDDDCEGITDDSD
ncbi:hypothetical protein M409DRAFT_54203 [Zasmidium cellare ATCC 36951]|uniref:Uncharacterized protein n=1 Tax=Zasmidium cellare ATCC 36951 TaxID=1080233 RepID=A0A6A6CP22_ZASCE|nr:uncharacterized protein M409DRAFT_54203 [Zasmidium cellare ATCC 36951]KAF2167622.1 hypothetical protein M409DRAFT_54203 [Zasmidium cellare ATCC 36951]